MLKYKKNFMLLKLIRKSFYGYRLPYIVAFLCNVISRCINYIFDSCSDVKCINCRITNGAYTYQQVDRI